MENLRKVGLWFAGLLFAPTLLLAITGFVFHATLGEPIYVKDTLVKADIYSSVEAYAARQVKQNQEFADQPQVKKALSDAIAKENVQSVVENSVDEIFLVLNGETASENLTIDLSPITNTFVKSLENNTLTSLQQLPTCTSISEAQTFEQNPLEATCIPPGIEPSQAVEQSLQEFLKDNEVLSSGKIDLATIGNSEDQQQQSKQVNTPSTESDPQPQEVLSQVGEGYRSSKLLFPIASVLFVLCVAGLVLLSRPKLKGVQRAGWLAVINGLVITIFSFLLHRLANSFAATRPETNDSLAAVFEDTGRLIVLDATSLTRIIGIFVFILGLAAAVTATIILKKKQPPKDSSNNNAMMSTPENTKTSQV